LASTNIETALLSVDTDTIKIVVDIGMTSIKHPNTAIQLLYIFNNTQAQRNIPPAG
jgi:hypothetical protein